MRIRLLVSQDTSDPKIAGGPTLIYIDDFVEGGDSFPKSFVASLPVITTVFASDSAFVGSPSLNR